MAISQHQVPRKLVAGMKVVVWIKPEVKLSREELLIGLRTAQWIKAEIVTEAKLIYAIKFTGRNLILAKHLVIVVRSTSWQDSAKKVTMDKHNPARNQTRPSRGKAAVAARLAAKQAGN